MGSNPVAPTNNINDLATLRGGFFMFQRSFNDSQKNSSFKKILTVRFQGGRSFLLHVFFIS